MAHNAMNRLAFFKCSAEHKVWRMGLASTKSQVKGIVGSAVAAMVYWEAPQDTPTLLLTAMRFQSQVLNGLVCLCISLLAPDVTVAESSVDFDRDVAPLIAQRCLACHSGNEPKGGLDLSNREAALKGGDSGPVWVVGKPEESLLWSVIENDTMPPKKPLPESEKVRIKAWIESGATWGTPVIDTIRMSTEFRAGFDWWSLQPLRVGELPPVHDAPPAWQKNPLDSFVYARLKEAGLQPSPTADRRLLIRRVYFDVLGIPPTPEQVDAFLKDQSPDAYRQLIDQLLQSPHYGERWGRHWLDVVRFGESNGFEYDEPRDNFWHYRNWVIDAFNADMPYDEFVRLQIAGDVLQPGENRALAAAGFLVAGPHNTTLPSNDVMKMTMAQDELEDLVGTVGQTFLGLTINCARCHEHKFDPITQPEYYQVAAALAGVQHGERKIRVDLTPSAVQERNKLLSNIEAVTQEIEQFELPYRTRVIQDRKLGKLKGALPPDAWARWEFDQGVEEANGKVVSKLVGTARIDNGALVLDGQQAYVETLPLPINLIEKTLVAEVQLDNLDQQGGGVVSLQSLGGNVFDAIVFGERESKRWMAGSNSFVRTQPFHGDEEKEAVERPVHLAIVYSADGRIVAYRNGMRYGEAYRPGDAAKFDSGKSQLLFGLRHSPAGGNRLLAGRIQRALLFDRALSEDEVAATAGVARTDYVSDLDLHAVMEATDRDRHSQLRQQLTELKKAVDAIDGQQDQKLYTVAPKDPGVVNVLRRGNVTDVGQAVAPAGLAAIQGLESSFDLAPNAPEGERRVRLAKWLTDQHNPLLARVMVNRVWHYHFGQGLVTTTNDFGFNGGRPSHPELLDWLALQFRDNGYRLKPLHRLILTSAAYCQASDGRSEALAMDADNRLLWRKSPLRLEAEALRDAALVASGTLDPSIGGRGYRDVHHVFYKNSNFYETIDEGDTPRRRRTVYRFAPRGGRNPFLDTFDCPDPSVTAPKRATTTTPLQALSLMNNALVFQLSEAFAQRVMRECGDKLDSQVQAAYRIVYGREVEPDEQQVALAFVSQHGMAAFCRVLFNSNEFLYVR